MRYSWRVERPARKPGLGGWDRASSSSVADASVALGRGRLTVLLYLLSASVLGDAKRSEEAMVCAARAVERGLQLGLVRTFVDEGEAAERQLARLVDAGSLDEPLQQYVAQLQAAFPEAARGRGSAFAALREERPSAQLVLTQRELEILGLVAEAMSNKRIALTLGITLETVKWNLRKIFSKLGVSSRYDAMVWARKQDLIR